MFQFCLDAFIPSNNHCLGLLCIYNIKHTHTTAKFVNDFHWSTDAMFLSGPPSVSDHSTKSSTHYQQLSAIQTVTGVKKRSFVLKGLQPGTLYAVVVVPFTDNVDGAASNTVYLQTSEDGQLDALSTCAQCRRSYYSRIHLGKFILIPVLNYNGITFCCFFLYSLHIHYN